MSIETWKAKYYPVPVHLCTDGILNELQHVRLKWSGLSSEALSEHGLYRSLITRNEIQDDEGLVVFIVDSSTCVLCGRYDCADYHKKQCPLINCHDDYNHWIYSSDNNPMLELIDSSIEKLRSKL